jgi:hypothetical protein
MRTYLASVVAVLVLSAHVLASSRTADHTSQRITLLLYVDAPQYASVESLNAMKRELFEMMNTPTVDFQFVTPEQAKPPAYFSTLVSVRLAGACNIETRTAAEMTKGALAFAHSSDGRILPFIEIECDRVRRHARSAFWGPDNDRTAYLYGRALARVLAHELYHVLTGRKQHTATGLTSKSLTGLQLISDAYDWEDESLHAVLGGMH